VVWLKANPDKAIYGSPGAGTFPHFAGMEFGRLSCLDFRHVAYRGTPAALPDLLSGRIAVFMSSPAELLELHKSGSIRILATTGNSRSTILPDIPTLKESGIDVDVPGWFAFYAPARMPAELVERLQNEIIAIVRLPNVHAKILAIGFEPTATTSTELKRSNSPSSSAGGRSSRHLDTSRSSSCHFGNPVGRTIPHPQEQG
jgi:tripartite-type tricarboxylate transporter receptor subunit TctC